MDSLGLGVEMGWKSGPVIVEKPGNHKSRATFHVGKDARTTKYSGRCQYMPPDIVGQADRSAAPTLYYTPAGFGVTPVDVRDFETRAGFFS